MTSYVIVDTDVFSHLWQAKQISSNYTHALKGAVPTLSFASVAEAHFGAAHANWGPARVGQMEAAMRRYVVAPYTTDLAVLWGKLKHQARKIGHPLGQPQQSNDLWVCTTAIFY